MVPADRPVRQRLRARNPDEPEISNVGALVVLTAGAVLSTRKGEGRSVLPESENMANGQWGSAQEPGRSCRLHGPENRPWGLPNQKKPLAPGPASWARGSESWTHHGTAKRRKTKRGGMGDGES